jgi:HSP20 family protein
MFVVLPVNSKVVEPFYSLRCYTNDIYFFTFKTKNMNYYQSCAAKGDYSGNRNRHLFIRSMQRAAVNIYKTETSFEMLVFAPGRIKENFSLGVKGNELTITYTPPEGFPRPDWILREYSRGGFVRTFTLDDSIDTQNVSAKYVDGVLQVTLPVIAGKESSNQEIKVG